MSGVATASAVALVVTVAATVAVTTGAAPPFASAPGLILIAPNTSWTHHAGSSD
jgi:hypothetical protein